MRTVVAFGVWVGLEGLGPLLAQQPLDEKAERLADLVNLRNTPVISAGRVLQIPAEAPAKVVILTAQGIRQRGYLDLEEALHDLAGFDFNKVMGVEWSTVFMRGFRSANSDRFLLIWDGVVQNDVWKQNANLSRQYPLGNVKRIEILYGPASLLYGPNAFNGIINVILNSEQESSPFSGQVAQGAFQAQLAEVHLAKDAGPWRAHFTARGYRGNEDHMDGKSWVDQGGRQRHYSLQFRPGSPGSDFVEPGDPRYALDVQNGQLYYQRLGQRVPFKEGFSHDSRDWFIQAGLGWRELEFRVQSWEMLEDQGAWHTAQNLIDSQRQVTGNAVYLTWRHGLSNGLSMETQYQMRTSGQFDQNGTSRPQAYFTNSIADPKELKVYAISDFGARTFNREHRISQLYTHQQEGLDMVFGWDYSAAFNHENYNLFEPGTGTYLRTPVHDERNLGLFGNIQTKVAPWLSLTGGLRRDYNYLAGEKGGFGHLSIPRIAAIFTMSPSHTVKVMQGDSYQTPPAQQKFTVVPGVREIASPDLRPERLKAFEVMYEYSPTVHWNATLNAFETSIDNFITSVIVPFGSGTTTKFTNQGGLRIQGLELESQYYLSPDASFYMNLTSVSAKDPTTGRRTGDIAALKGNLGFDYRSPRKWGLSVRSHYVGPRDTVNWDSKSLYVVRRVGAYFTVDLSLSLLDLWKGLDLRLNAYNLMNREYYDPGPRSADGKTYNAAILQQPRRIMMGLAWHF
ncbi:MAG TPA: TonB-dependent receptor [Holophagaceae bacterium]|nr:TonB-dependent receptor [Holophagaceae bacterium]